MSERIKTGNRIRGSAYEPREIRKVVTQAELRALHSSDVEIIPAPDDDDLIVVDYWIINRPNPKKVNEGPPRVIAAGAAYTAGSAIHLRYGSTSNYAASTTGAALGNAAKTSVESGIYPGTTLTDVQRGAAINAYAAASLGNGEDDAEFIVGYHVLQNLAERVSEVV